MKKIIAIMITFICLFMVILGSAAFTLRSGMEWYMTKEQVQKCLQKESDYSNYVVGDESEMKEYLYQMSPQEKDNPKLWLVYATNVSLGRDDEKVLMVLGGTKPNGLYNIIYWVYPNDGKDESLYSRAKDLQSQLSKKYGTMDVKDQWKKRNSIKSQNNVYDSWITLSDGTVVYIYIINNEGTLELRIEYRCSRWEEIENSIRDGSLYIDPAFGL